MMPKQKPAQTRWAQRCRRFIEELPIGEVAPRPMLHRLRRTAQFIHLVGRGFVVNRCPARAAALSYTTLLALIPLLAVTLSFSKQFLQNTSADFVPKLMSQLVSNIAPALDVSAEAKQQAVEQIQSFIGNIQAGTLGTVGSLFLVVVAIRLLMTIEQAFNDIWGVTQGRSIWRKVVYYWAAITLGPLLLFAAIYVTGRTEFSALYGKLRFTAGFERLFLRSLPFFVLWIGFALVYALMPNTRVRPRAALAGGIVAGTLWQINSLLNALYVSRMITYSKIYGALGIIPLFLVGLYCAWLIVLFGAQVSFAAQNVRAYWQQRAMERIDQRTCELLACRAVLMICRQFQQGRPPLTVEQLAESLNAPLQFLNRLVHRLIEGGVLAQVAGEDGGLQPSRPLTAIRVTDVLQVVRVHDSEAANEGSREVVAGILSQLCAAERSAPANARFSELVEIAPTESQAG